MKSEELRVESEELKGREANAQTTHRLNACIQPARVKQSYVQHLLFVILLFASTIVFAQDIPARPVPPRLVNDFANVLSNSQIQTLENKLVRYNDTTSTQICIVTIDDLSGTTTADFAYQIGEKWGVGHKENNGAVILVKPKKGDERGGVSIQVGYGLEPFVTDALAKRIIEKEMIPAFKENDYYTGIDKATDVIIALASGQFKAEEYAENDDLTGVVVVVFALLFVIFCIFISKGNNGGTMSGKGKDGSFWETLFWLSLFSNSGQHNDWGGFSGGSGGFGGFGGGSFGGGGASGSW